MSAPIAVIKLEAALLKSALPDLVLRPGAVLAARVGERRGDHGLLMLAGSAVVAELPEQVRTGDRLKLSVEEMRGDRVVLRLLRPEDPAAPAAPVAVPLPGGAVAHVRVAERQDEAPAAAADEARSVSLVYDSPALGTIDLRVSMQGGGVAAQVTVAAGPPLALAEAGRRALEEALCRATGRRADVRVSPRRGPLDVYA